MRSIKTAQFHRRFQRLPPAMQRRAREKYKLFQSDPHHSSFAVKVVRATESWEQPHWEYRISKGYRATCYIDGHTYVWVFIGNHDEFEEFYR
ncbi:MAG: hypothetical protein HY318_09100 [Armatimonadetes bacterium]|nr:hypothetical protein [Armatimonadota bacterium]